MREASYVLGTKAEGGVKQNVALVAMVTCCCDTFRGGRDITIQYTLFRNAIYS